MRRRSRLHETHGTGRKRYLTLRSKTCLSEVIIPALEGHRGRIVKNTGDGFIAIFDSVVDGLTCALAMQKGIDCRKDDAPVKFRMGLNVGDIIVEEGDVFGDGVNVAARLQAMAVPGGVCVSALIRDQLRGKLVVEFESLGRRRGKKGEEPIRCILWRTLRLLSGTASPT